MVKAKVLTDTFVFDNTHCLDLGVPGYGIICRIPEGAEVEVLSSSHQGPTEVKYNYNGDHIEGYMKTDCLALSK